MKNKIGLFLFLSFICCLSLMFVLFLVFKITYPLKYKEEIFESCKKFNVDEELIFAIIKSESDFNADAKSKVGAEGLMQILPSTAEFVANELLEYDNMNINLLNPQNNIEIGTRYIKYLFDKFERLQLVIIAYNAGETNLIEFMKNGEIESGTFYTPFKETNAFLEKVLRNMKIYAKKLTFT